MFPQFDPSKMDPKLLMELSQLIQKLPHDKLMKMQSLMHNMMAGFDVRKDMEEFEKSLPPEFREKLFSIMAQQAATGSVPFANEPTQAANQATISPIGSSESTGSDQNVREARLTVLRAVADGRMSPEEAESVLFQ